MRRVFFEKILLKKKGGGGRTHYSQSVKKSVPHLLTYSPAYRRQPRGRLGVMCFLHWVGPHGSLDCTAEFSRALPRKFPIFPCILCCPIVYSVAPKTPAVVCRYTLCLRGVMYIFITVWVETITPTPIGKNYTHCT